jgi:hypothetical protein
LTDRVKIYKKIQKVGFLALPVHPPPRICRLSGHFSALWVKSLDSGAPSSHSLFFERNSMSDPHATPHDDAHDVVEEIVPMMPIVLPIAGAVLMFLLAFIAVFMA